MCTGCQSLLLPSREATIISQSVFYSWMTLQTALSQIPLFRLFDKDTCKKSSRSWFYDKNISPCSIFRMQDGTYKHKAYWRLMAALIKTNTIKLATPKIYKQVYPVTRLCFHYPHHLLVLFLLTIAHFSFPHTALIRKMRVSE